LRDAYVLIINQSTIQYLGIVRVQAISSSFGMARDPGLARDVWRSEPSNTGVVEVKARCAF